MTAALTFILATLLQTPSITPQLLEGRWHCVWNENSYHLLTFKADGTYIVDDGKDFQGKWVIDGDNKLTLLESSQGSTATYKIEFGVQEWCLMQGVINGGPPQYPTITLVRHPKK